MPLPTEKVEEILLEYHFMCKLESSHMQASIVSTLPYIRPWANRWRFALILRTLVDNSEMSEILNPTEILHSISFVLKLQQFQRFCLICKQNLFKKTEITVTTIPQSTYGKLFNVNWNIFLTISKPFSHVKSADLPEMVQALFEVL